MERPVDPHRARSTGASGAAPVEKPKAEPVEEVEDVETAEEKRKREEARKAEEKAREEEEERERPGIRFCCKLRTPLGIIMEVHGPSDDHFRLQTGGFLLPC